MSTYKAIFRVEAMREMEIEADSPDDAIFKILEWQQDPRLGCHVTGAITHPHNPSISILDAAGRKLLSSKYTFKWDDEAEIEGAPDDEAEEEER